MILSASHPHVLQLIAIVCLCKGQQTLSEEVSERTRSQVLKLEKENQSLLRTIEELQAASMKSSTQPNHNHHLERDQVVCSTNNRTSSTGEPTGFQPSCSHVENVFQHCTVTKQVENGDSNCRQQPHAEELDAVHSEILLTDNPDLHVQEKGQLEDGQRGDHFKELMCELEVLENNHNRLGCFVESRDCFPSSKSSSSLHDLTGLPTRSSYAASKHTQRLEAKCRALDTVNQHLQTSLDNTGRFCRSNRH